MTVISRVSAFIKAQPGKRFCDACIKEGVDAPRRVSTNEATRRLSKRGVVLRFVRSEDVCDTCGERRLVISTPIPLNISASALRSHSSPMSDVVTG